MFSSRTSAAGDRARRRASLATRGPYGGNVRRTTPTTADLTGLPLALHQAEHQPSGKAHDFRQFQPLLAVWRAVDDASVGITDIEDLARLSEDELRALGVPPHKAHDLFLAAREARAFILWLRGHEVRKAALLRELAMLDDAYEMGVVDDEEYDRQRDALLQRMRQLLMSRPTTAWHEGSAAGPDVPKAAVLRLSPPPAPSTLVYATKRGAAAGAGVGAGAGTGGGTGGREGAGQRYELAVDAEGCVDLAGLPDGEFVVELFTRAEPPIPLHMAEVVVSARGTAVAPDAVDVPCTRVSQRFRVKGEAVADGAVQGTFVPAGGSTRHVFDYTLDADGYGGISVPRDGGVLENVSVTPLGGKPVPTKAVHVSKFDASAPVRRVEVDQGGSLAQVRTEATADGGAARVVMLGDVSGSMSSGKRIPFLKASYLRQMKEVAAAGGKIALCNWNTAYTWCASGSGGNAPAWVSDPSAMQAFVNATKASGGNDMRNVVKCALAEIRAGGALEGATDVIILGDGDVTPYANVKVGAPACAEWKRAVDAHPGVRFSFVALGEGADYTSMQAMAAAGRGTFYDSTTGGM